MIDLNAISQRLGIPAGTVMDASTLIHAFIAVAIAWGIGALIAIVIAPRVRRGLDRFLQSDISKKGDRIGRILGGSTAFLLFYVETHMPMFDPFGMLIIAVALGITATYVVFQIARALQMSATWGYTLGVMAGVTATAGRLGGLGPLVESLDNAGFNLAGRDLTLLDVIHTLLIVGFLFALTRLILRMSMGWISSAGNLDGSQRVLFQKLSTVGIVAIAFFIGIDLLGIDLTALAVFSGALGLAVGFGMQKTFGNLLAGIILLTDKSIKPGDVIVVGDTFGWVNKIGVRAVSVLTRDGKEFLIPNETLMTETVENWSYSNRNIRVKIPIGVSYGCDVHKARELMRQAVEDLPRVLSDPPAMVWMTGFGDSSVDFEIRIWISDAEAGIGNIKSEVLTRVWDLFKEHNIEIPFPQRDLHVRTWSPPPDDQ